MFLSTSYNTGSRQNSSPLTGLHDSSLVQQNNDMFMNFSRKTELNEYVMFQSA